MHQKHPPKKQTPEERELEKKQAELTALESELAQRELDLATVLAEMHSFERRYLSIIGAKYAKLDEIEAQILEAQARQKPHDAKICKQASQARTKAQESAHDAGVAEQSKETKEFKPSERLKQLYRNVAKAMHPDLAIDEEERARRHRLMSEANRAYEEGNEAKLQAILHEWESSPESVKGDSTGAELVRVIRKIAQVEERFHAIESEIAGIQESYLYQLKTKAEEAKTEGRNLLTEMALQVEKRIEDAQKRLDKIMKEMIHV
jgi:hypothetical protein